MKTYLFESLSMNLEKYGEYYLYLDYERAPLAVY